MNERNIIINSIYNLFKKELASIINTELTMDSTKDSGEVMIATVIHSDSQIIDSESEEKIIKLKIKNTKGTSFFSLDKLLDGKKIIINDVDEGIIIEHQIKEFDYVYDTILIKGLFTNIDNIYDINDITIINSDIIYLYVRNGNLPQGSAFNRMCNKGIFLLFQFQIICKNDENHTKIESYTNAFENIYYGKYKRSFPIVDENNKILTYSNSSFSDMNINDYLVKSDNVIVRIITIPVIVNLNYYKN